MRGRARRRPALEQKQSFVAPAPDEPLEREEGYALLARRFLEAYGPATPRDLAYWGKVTVTDAKRAFEDADGLEQVATARGPMWALPGPGRAAATRGEPVVRLLPVWENYLLGLRGPLAGGPAAPRPHAGRRASRPRPPTASPSATGGSSAGTAEIEVVIEPFGRLPRAARPGLSAEAEDVGRFLGQEAGLRIERP